MTLALLFLLSGCAVIQPVPEKVCTCPENEIVIPVQSPYGTMFVPIPKGSLDNPDNYITSEKFKEMLDKWEKDEQEHRRRMGI